MLSYGEYIGHSYILMIINISKKKDTNNNNSCRRQAGSASWSGEAWRFMPAKGDFSSCPHKRGKERTLMLDCHNSYHRGLTYQLTWVILYIKPAKGFSGRNIFLA
jgi:hypothetical protein